MSTLCSMEKLHKKINEQSIILRIGKSVINNHHEWDGFEIEWLDTFCVALFHTIQRFSYRIISFVNDGIQLTLCLYAYAVGRR